MELEKASLALSQTWIIGYQVQGYCHLDTMGSTEQNENTMKCLEELSPGSHCRLRRYLVSCVYLVAGCALSASNTSRSALRSLRCAGIGM